jgi:four helix bundle protein
VRAFIAKLPRTISNIEDVKQLVRASGSVAANYIEANEALSKKDFLHRIKICHKESKESRLWLRLIKTGTAPQPTAERDALIQEATELIKIFNAIAGKAE